VTAPGTVAMARVDGRDFLSGCGTKKWEQVWGGRCVGEGVGVRGTVGTGIRDLVTSPQILGEKGGTRVWGV